MQPGEQPTRSTFFCSSLLSPSSHALPTRRSLSRLRRRRPFPLPTSPPTLYFSSPSEEIGSRNALHVRVTDLVRDLALADPAALPETLKVSDQVLISLQRHSAYLKVRSLEDTQDQAAKDAGEAVETDQSVLEAAIKSRLRLMPKDQVAALGPYALLAQEATKEVAHAFSPDTERYRGIVTASFEQDIQNTYDRLTETLGSSKEASSTTQ